MRNDLRSLLELVEEDRSLKPSPFLGKDAPANVLKSYVSRAATKRNYAPINVRSLNELIYTAAETRLLPFSVTPSEAATIALLVQLASNLDDKEILAVKM